MKDPINFPLKPVEDWIVIDRIPVKTKDEKKMESLDIVKGPGIDPKNVLDVEKKRKDEYTTYAQASEALLKKWSEHPNQGYVKAVGPGRHLEEGVKIPVPVKPGDKIYYRGQTGEPVIVNKKLYYMIKQHEVFGVVSKKNKSKK